MRTKPPEDAGHNDTTKYSGKKTPKNAPACLHLKVEISTQLQVGDRLLGRTPHTPNKALTRVHQRVRFFVEIWNGHLESFLDARHHRGPVTATIRNELLAIEISTFLHRNLHRLHQTSL